MKAAKVFIEKEVCKAGRFLYLYLSQLSFLMKLTLHEFLSCSFICLIAFSFFHSHHSFYALKESYPVA